MKKYNTLLAYVDGQREQYPERIWLRDRNGDAFTEWSFAEGHAEISAAAAWFEQRYGASLYQTIDGRARGKSVAGKFGSNWKPVGGAPAQGTRNTTYFDPPCFYPYFREDRRDWSVSRD